MYNDRLDRISCDIVNNRDISTHVGGWIWSPAFVSLLPSSFSCPYPCGKEKTELKSPDIIIKMDWACRNKQINRLISSKVQLLVTSELFVELGLVGKHQTFNFFRTNNLILAL